MHLQSTLCRYSHNHTAVQENFTVKVLTDIILIFVYRTRAL